jgi:hypothetical protein
MNSKKKKYNNIQSTLNLFNSQVDSICLITHVNDLNTIQTNLLKIYCNENNISLFSTKLNLLRKLTKNSYFTNIFAGPTKLFFFPDFESFSAFLDKQPLEKKIIPLCVYFNNSFFNFPLFEEKLKLFKKNFKLDKSTFKLNFISLLNNKSVNLIRVLSIHVSSFITFLSYLKKNK